MKINDSMELEPWLAEGYELVDNLKEEYKDLQDEFLAYATSQGMVGVKGHRDVGGFRASCYNAMSIEGCEALVKCMKEFEAKH